MQTITKQIITVVGLSAFVFAIWHTSNNIPTNIGGDIATTTPMIPLKEKLKTADKKQSIDIRTEEIQKLVSTGVYKRSELDYEIGSIEKIEGGFQLYVRAWDKNGNQKGFGKDGTVEYERIRFFLTEVPSLVYVHDGVETVGTTTVEKYREDPKEAFLQRMDTVVSSIVKDGSKIVKGKKGKTTSVIDNDPNTTDQHLSDAKATYTLARDATTATVFSLAGAGNQNYLHNSLIGTYYVRRAQVAFNTSVIGAGQEVSATTMTLYSAASGGADTNSYDVVLLDNTNNAAMNDPIVAEDFNDYGTVSIGSRDLTDLTNKNANVAITLTNFDAINMTGTTTIGMRLSGDINNSTPTGSNVLRIGQGSDFPFLTVTHAEAATDIPRTHVSPVF